MGVGDRDMGGHESVAAPGEGWCIIRTTVSSSSLHPSEYFSILGEI